MPDKTESPNRRNVAPADHPPELAEEEKVKDYPTGQPSSSD